jgi:dTDP-4-amino-4,6-dideoxygalactose transaminase
MKPILTGLAPNTEADDARLAVKQLFRPWFWGKEDAKKELEESLAKRLPAKSAVVFSCGRMALFSVLSSLNLRKDDEVLLQAFTCLAVPNPVLWSGAKPIYVDCDPLTLTMDCEDLERKIPPHARVIIIQHTFGEPADLSRILAVAKKHGLFVIEDCAHTLDSFYKGQRVGTFADASIFSFGRDKAISSVFGGCATTNDLTLAKHLKEEQEKLSSPPWLWTAQQLFHPILCALIKATFSIGIGRIILSLSKRFSLLSKPVQPGEKKGLRPSFLSYRLPNPLALLALNQLSKLDRFTKHREALSRIYREGLASTSFVCPTSLPEAKPSYLRFTVRIKSAASLRARAKERGIFLGDWYSSPLAPQGADCFAFTFSPESCPKAVALTEETLNLPTDINTSEEDARRIVSFLKSSL